MRHASVLRDASSAADPRGGAVDLRRPLDASDDGRLMSLAEFWDHPKRAGVLFELARGVVQVRGQTTNQHETVQDRFRDACILHKAANPRAIAAVRTAAGSVVVVDASDSARRPDVAVYLTPAPLGVDHPWDVWTPEIVVEVVSESGRERDYVEKVEDYGGQPAIREYVIVDAFERRVTVYRRAGEAWAKAMELAGDAVYETPLLPGFRLTLAELFGA